MDFLEADWTISDDATLKEIKQKLDFAERLIQNGRFVLAVGTDKPGNRVPENYLFHWFYPTEHAFETNKQVGSGGDLATCFRDLGQYVREFQGPKL